MIMSDTEIENVVQGAKQLALKLESDRMKLEGELKEWLSILNQNSIGMNEVLVDVDGYPRADVDVYQIGHARHRIICIRNDLKNVMKQIEEQLHIIHTQGKNSLCEVMEYEVSHGSAIAEITSVVADSPADEAGLKSKDLIINFGSACSRNFSGLDDIKKIVQRSINQTIKVIVSRSGRIVELCLKPYLWAGQGVLGCIILPIENVER